VKTESLIIFYDGYCPLCVKEMRQLKKRDNLQKLIFADVNDSGFENEYPDISPQDALTKLHGYLFHSETKHLLTGLDVTYHAWRMVGRGWMIAPLRWPIIRWFSDKIYLWFARNRFTISKLLTGQSRCETCKLPLD